MEIKKLHIQFHNILSRYIAARVNNKDDVADILQEIFIKIVSKIDSLSDNEKLNSWIFTIARNTIIDYYRKNNKNGSAAITEKIMDEVQGEVDLDTTKGLDKCLKNFIKKLPEGYREIIIDSELKGTRQKDLAEKYNLAYPTVRSRVQRGRSKLKEMLLDCCKIESDSRGNIITASRINSCDDVCGDCS